ncbi:F11L ortholog [Fowlpox virus]|uniref:F11L ortholog n=1 Tax=Fowlpox virus TaxID=10261 RepID=A0A7G0WT32_FOWPV|nr:F11L ortholog [Fowlpox virus]
MDTNRKRSLDEHDTGEESPGKLQIVEINDEEDITFTDNPYYELVKSRDNSINLVPLVGCVMIKINDIKGVTDKVNKLLPKTSSKTNSTSCINIPIDSIPLNFLDDGNKYFNVSEVSILQVSHGNDMMNIDKYVDGSFDYIAVLCLKNSGRSVIMLNHCNKQHVMQDNFCLIFRSFYVINILTQIIGESVYLLVKLSPSDLFKIRWSSVIDSNRFMGKKFYIRNLQEDACIEKMKNMEKDIYKNIEFIIINSVLLEDLKSRLDITRELNHTIDKMFNHNNNTLFSDIIKLSEEIIDKDFKNMEKMSDSVLADVKQISKTKNKLRERLLKAAISSKEVEEILSDIPVIEEGTIKQFSLNQRAVYDHYKKVIYKNNSSLDLGCMNIEKSYMFNLYKVYGQNEYMITYILNLINRVKKGMDAIKSNLGDIYKYNIDNINLVVSERINKVISGESL